MSTNILPKKGVIVVPLTDIDIEKIKNGAELDFGSIEIAPFHFALKLKRREITKT